MKNGLGSINVAILKYLYCEYNQLTEVDVSYNTGLYHLYLTYMPSLEQVCVWEIPFPPEGIHVDTTGSPNVNFTIECNK